MSIDENTPTSNPTEATTTEATTPQVAEQATTTAPATQASPSTPTTEEAGAAPPAEEEPKPRRRGFAAMDRSRVKEIASKGGRAAHAAGTAHQFSADEARVAGKKGGLAPHVRRGGVRRRPSTEQQAPISQQSAGR